MMFLQKIHKMKWLQIILSFILCFALMFCIVSKSVEVKAVVGIDDGIFWAIVAALAEMGIVVTITDPEVREAVSDFFWSCTDAVRDDIGMIAAAVKVGYSVYYDASVEAWSRIANAISEWFTTERYPQQDSDFYGTVAVSNNVVNLYESGSLSFTFPELNSSASRTVHFLVNDCSFDFYVNYSNYTDYFLWGYDSYANQSTAPRSNKWDFVIQPNDYNFHLVYDFGADTSLNSGATIYNGVFSIDGCSFYGDSFSMSFINNYTTFVSGYNSYYVREHNGSWAFVNRFDDSDTYNNLTFSTKFELYKWFFDLCGIDISPSQPSVYVPGKAETLPFTINPDTVQNALDNIADLPADSTVPLILPGTETQYNQLVSSVPVSSLYDADIDIPTVNGNLWKTKFPFCIPFDLINLFSGFSSEAEAPSFHVLVMPANSFGLDNDDIYWDIDFAPYNYLVQILRFFLALSFVLWLIVITRKLIRG